MQYFREAVHAQPNERAWVTYIKAKVTEQNQSFPSLVVGQTGSGKSWGTLRLCQELEDGFQLEGNWFFRALDFYKAFSKYYKDKENKKRGKIWVLDEAGVDFSSDDWQNKVNKIFAKVFSTARFRNYIFFGTVPFTDFISKKIRQLMQYRMTANYLEKQKNGTMKSVFVPRCLYWSDHKQDYYQHKLLRIEKTGEEVPINRVLLQKPCKRLRVEYEKRREEFIDNLDKELLGQLEDSQTDQDNLMKLTPKYEELLKLKREGVPHIKIAEELNVTYVTIANMIKRMRKYGWDFVRNKDGNRIYNPETKVWEFYPHDKL